MDVREKLVELLGNIYLPMMDGSNTVGEYTIPYKFKEKIADHLIANGVTVQGCGHWVSLTDCANAGVYCSVCHKKVYKEDYAYCSRKNKLRSSYCPHCVAKMMSQPPKGE